MDLVREKAPLVGITATLPAEVVYAAGFRPVDLNNVFISSEAPGDLVKEAEAAGFPHTICAWIKGIYGAVLRLGLEKVIAVTGGDCSNTVALGEILSFRGVEVIPFEYPLSRDRTQLKDQMEKLMKALGTTWEETRRMRDRLRAVRKKLMDVDSLTFLQNTATGLENHLFLVRSSDFESDPDAFEVKLDAFLQEARTRRPRGEEVRLGYLGVPPIFSGLYEHIESLGARVVFNETQRQFSMPYQVADLIDQYLRYTYPYGVRARLADITEAVHERRLDGLIHYTQTFCYRQMYDILLRKALPLPLLTLEGDKPGPLDSRSAFRIETFIEILRDGKSRFPL